MSKFIIFAKFIHSIFLLLTNNVIATYYSNHEICKKFQMSVTSLKKASDLGNIHHGYKWKILC